VLGETAGLLSPALVAAKAPQIAGGLLQAGRNLAAPKTLNPQTGAIVWHGSPHKFDAFDSSKIGTGEGAQAYGHGLYLAENPAVAQEYKRVLSDRYAADIARGRNEISRAKQYAAKYQSMLDDPSIPRGRMRDGSPTPDEWVRKRAAEELDNVAAHERWLANKEAGGSLYKVDLPDEKIASMLDWDGAVSEAQRKPLSQAAMRDFGSDLSGTSGEHLYKEVVFEFKNAGHANPTQAATDWLRKNGAPGIRYLDAGSRSAGAGSSNFVVFPGEENALSILERNGQGLLSP
jgi:hypothetical protein